MRPLDRFGSIKLKLGVVILAAVAVSALVSTVGLRRKLGSELVRTVHGVGYALEAGR